LQGLLAQNSKGLIWDLSSNGGGSMQAAQDILSYLIEDGLLFSADLKGNKAREFRAEGEALAADIPLVVLDGERTYSAAETGAGTIAETGRGTVIGGTTYGEGTIQATYPLGDGALLQMTIVKWLSPHGEWYRGRGVTFDRDLASARCASRNWNCPWGRSYFPVDLTGFPVAVAPFPSTSSL
jgi:carboxyl-terminal processing protease